MVGGNWNIKIPCNSVSAVSIHQIYLFFFVFFQTGEIVDCTFCSRLYFSHICHHEDKPPNDAGINSPLRWRCRALPIAEGLDGPAVETISNHWDAKLE